MILCVWYMPNTHAPMQLIVHLKHLLRVFISTLINYCQFCPNCSRLVINILWFSLPYFSYYSWNLDDLVFYYLYCISFFVRVHLLCIDQFRNTAASKYLFFKLLYNNPPPSPHILSKFDNKTHPNRAEPTRT